MFCREDEDARRYYLGKLRGILDGSIKIPELSLGWTRDPEIINAHECELCPAKHYLRRITPNPKPESDRAILMFMRGRLFERILADELPPKVLDGISGRVDGTYPPNGTLIETKSTAQDMSKFDPLISQPHWLQRSKAYCTLHERNKILLVVWFLVGDMWTKKTTGTGLKVWELEFDSLELQTNWVYMRSQAESLLWHVKNRVFPKEQWMLNRLKDFECGDCQFWLECEYPKKRPLKT